MTDSISKQILLSVLGIALLIIAIVGISYAVFTTTLRGSEENVITTGTISMSYVEATNGISISNAMPISDYEGKNLTGENNVFDFTVSSVIKGKTTVNYEVVAEKVSVDGELVPDQNVRLYLQKKVADQYVDTEITSIPSPFVSNGSVSVLGSPAEGMILYKGDFTSGEASGGEFSESFRLRMWLSEDSVIDEIPRMFKIRVNVYGKVL